MFWILTCTWETQTGFPIPWFSLTKPLMLQSFGEQTCGWKISLLHLFSVYTCVHTASWAGISPFLQLFTFKLKKKSLTFIIKTSWLKFPNPLVNMCGQMTSGSWEKEVHEVSMSMVRGKSRYYTSLPPHPPLSTGLTWLWLKFWKSCWWLFDFMGVVWRAESLWLAET